MTSVVGHPVMVVLTRLLADAVMFRTRNGPRHAVRARWNAALNGESSLLTACIRSFLCAQELVGELADMVNTNLPFLSVCLLLQV